MIGCGILVAKVTELWQACHEFKPGAAEDLPCRGAMRIKSVESSNVLLLVWCGMVGGLLSAHLLSKKAGMDVDPGWPCSGPLLTLAEKVARRLLPAFETKTGMPFGTVNLLYGVPEGETPITCTAGVSTFIIEFGTLSQLTGDPVFENVAVNALDALWKRRSPLGLVSPLFLQR
ncbi:ER degradation-enhancing alpha-mannosidase-like protein 2 [Trichonephila clavipes]|nr:ER degradation-enhancing alpha-mannosidase-like protein 2 [Trichonephila clavipes]